MMARTYRPGRNRDDDRREARGNRRNEIQHAFRARAMFPAHVFTTQDLARRKIELLPTSALQYYYGADDSVLPPPQEWTDVKRTLLAGTRDVENSPLGVLRNYETTLVRKIYSFLTHRWAHHVRLTIPAALVGKTGETRLLRFSRGRSSRSRRDVLEGFPTVSSNNTTQDGFIAFAKCGYVEFPEPQNRNVNMMPFVFGSRESLPEFLRDYYPLIEATPYLREEIGNIGYLTVHESFVEAGQPQRRPGLHIESPGVFQDVERGTTSFSPAVERHGWGTGLAYGPDRFEGGIYFASNVADTSMLWDALVDNKVPGIVDRHGGCEQLRHIIGDGTKLGANELVWMTDCTPHEALPQTHSGVRQFFRVVTPYVSHWYADHSTPNPSVPVPAHVKIVRGDKFAQGKRRKLDGSFDE